DRRISKRGEEPSVKPSVTNKKERYFCHSSKLRLEEELRRLPCRDVGCGDEIAQRPETAFESEAGLFHHLCVQPHAAKLDKIFPICTRQIDQADGCAFDDIPAALEIVQWQAKLHRENIHASHWEHA